MINRSLLTAGLFSLALFAGCASEEAAKDKDFHTSGNREADQRAEQMIAKDQQIRGEAATGDQSDVKPTLYARLGQDEGIKVIVSDWVDRALADPRVNWKRLGVTSGGVLGVGAKSETWTPTPAHHRADEEAHRAVHRPGHRRPRQIRRPRHGHRPQGHGHHQ